MLVHTEILVKKPLSVLLHASGRCFSSRWVWFAPWLLPFHIPFRDKSYVGGLHPPDDKPFVVQWDAMWYQFLIFSHIGGKNSSSVKGIEIWRVNGRMYPYLPLSLRRTLSCLLQQRFWSKSVAAEDDPANVTVLLTDLIVFLPSSSPGIMVDDVLDFLKAWDTQRWLFGCLVIDCDTGCQYHMAHYLLVFWYRIFNCLWWLTFLWIFQSHIHLKIIFKNI